MTPEQNTRRIVFVCRALSGENLRMAKAINKLEGVTLLGVCEQLPQGDLAPVFTDLIGLASAHDVEQLLGAARLLAEKHGKIERMVTTTETLLEPVARVSESLGLQGLRVAAIGRALDKSQLKSTLAQAGVSTAHDRLLTSREEATDFAKEVGFPIVLKPPGGSGALATLCIRSLEQLELALDLMQPTPQRPVLAEVYLNGQELCLDTITLDDEPLFYSICCYEPPILKALEDPQIQWTCVMPRDITDDRYQNFIHQGLKAVRALSVGNAMTHMEGFLIAGGGHCFTDATLRPAGARIGPMLAFAYDLDPYLTWAKVALEGRFDGPWERRYAVGTVFLRGIGSGLVEQVTGIASVKQELGEWLADAWLPRLGAAKSATYTGDGYITVRHPDTSVVQEALGWIAQRVQISYTQAEFSASASASRQGQWSQRLQYFAKRLNQPAWEEDALPGRNRA